MIKTLTINNFKSIRSLSLECKRVNLFIGEPNTGKSNILEALGLLNFLSSGPSKVLKDYVRYENPNNLFYDSILDDSIKIKVHGNEDYELELKSVGDHFEFLMPGKEEPMAVLNSQNQYTPRWVMPVKDIFYYKYRKDSSISLVGTTKLSTPDGDNLFMTAYSSKENREMISNLFKPYGLKAIFKPSEKTIEIQKQQDDIAVAYPYSMTSDTLLRIIFYMLAIKSNKDATLVFEEPEAHAFPYYTKHLGEVIAADTSNQYFIATHNPYLLNAIIEKAKIEDVNVIAVYYEDYQTKIKQLSETDIADLLEQDPFLAIDHFTGK
jgi:hypothetical protein